MSAKKKQKKKVIYAEIDDEITSIFDKIVKARRKHVFVVVPKRAVIFQSLINLRILKSKLAEKKKEFSLITNDSNGINLAFQLGIPVYNKENSEGHPTLFTAAGDDEKLRITPLKASVNSVEESAPTRLKMRKISISEILKKSKRTNSIDLTKKPKKSSKKAKKKLPRLVVIAPNRHALIGLVTSTVLIFLVIAYIALPGVTVYLTPAASVLEKSVNITLADAVRNSSILSTRPPQMLPSYPIQTVASKTITHQATGKQFSERGANASGSLTIYNTSNTEWPLIPQTRFQTEEGIVFRIASEVRVPPASAGGPGQLEVQVVADEVDANGLVAGERGNVGPSRFFLPGLREESRELIYAESSQPMTGGVTDYTTFVSEEDLEAARVILEEELLKTAVDELKLAVEAKEAEFGGEADFTLLEGDGAVEIGEVTLGVPDANDGDEIKEFTISGEINVSGIYYPHDEMIDILMSELESKRSPQKELLRVNENSTSYRIFERDEAAGTVRLTANIKGIEQFSIDPENENGARIIVKIRDHIAGQNIDDAKIYIQNLPQINKVEIDSWPAWSPTIPKLVENIEFEVREALTVQ